LFSNFSQKLVVRMEITPAWFPISRQRIGGVHGRPKFIRGVICSSFFI